MVGHSLHTDIFHPVMTYDVHRIRKETIVAHQDLVEKAYHMTGHIKQPMIMGNIRPMNTAAECTDMTE